MADQAVNLNPAHVDTTGIDPADTIHTDLAGSQHITSAPSPVGSLPLRSPNQQAADEASGIHVTDKGTVVLPRYGTEHDRLAAMPDGALLPGKVEEQERYPYRRQPSFHPVGDETLVEGPDTGLELEVEEQTRLKG